MITENIRLRASNSERWTLCPGSARLEYDIPDIPSKYANEGILAHAVAAEFLTSTRSREALKEYMYYTGLCENEELFINVYKYLDYIADLLPIGIIRNKWIFIERNVDFSHVIPNTYDPTGTCDALIVDDKNKTLHIIDLKYGKGVKVEVINNTQLVLYALGAINDLQFLYDIEKVVLHIVQPRMCNYQAQELSIKELESWKAFFIEKSQLALSENAPRIAGDKQCKFCKAKSICPEYQEFKKPFSVDEFDTLTITTQEN